MGNGGLYYTEEEIRNFKEIFSFISGILDGFAQKYSLLLKNIVMAILNGLLYL